LRAIGQDLPFVWLVGCFLASPGGVDARLLSGSANQRTFAIVFGSGDRVLDGLRGFAASHAIAAAAFTAIGAFRRVTLGYFDVEQRDYRQVSFDEQVEVLSLTGNIARGPDGVAIHAHVVIGRADATAHGGHLLEATVRPTLEVVATEAPAHLRRRIDAATGLPLLDLHA
jgi:predicted DNA-binding protein with PD1-like motif